LTSPVTNPAGWISYKFSFATVSVRDFITPNGLREQSFVVQWWTTTMATANNPANVRVDDVTLIPGTITGTQSSQKRIGMTLRCVYP